VREREREKEQKKKWKGEYGHTLHFLGGGELFSVLTVPMAFLLDFLVKVGRREGKALGSGLRCEWKEGYEQDPCWVRLEF
jgi:hypothetical protein